jgi:ABC-type transport system substrate-binding protein
MFIPLALLSAFAAVASSSTALAGPEVPSSPATAPATSTAAPQPAAAPVAAVTTADPVSVYVGVYLRDISRFELEEGQFEADLDVWMKWEGSAEPPPLRFSNGDLDVQDVVAQETEGKWHAMRWHVQGTFRGKFDLHDFPYDAQPLEIRVELPSSAAQDGAERAFRLLPDAASSGMSDEFSITGWVYERAFTVREFDTRLASDLGSVRQEGLPRTGQVIAYRIVMSRPFISYIIKFLLPLSIIILVSMSVFWMDEDRLDVRSSVGVTGVLSCIAFHFTQADTLPDVGYLVRADLLFLLAYTVVALALFVTLVVFRLSTTRQALAKRIDAAARVCTPIGFIAAAWLILSPPAHESEAEVDPVAAPLSATARTSHDDTVYIQAVSNRADHAEFVTYCTVGTLTTTDTDRTAASGPTHLLDRMPSVTNDLVRFLADGGMDVIWRLRSGTRWSDGHPIDSGDLYFTLGTLPGAASGHRQVIDARTVRVRWPDRAAAHLEDFRLLPEHAVAEAAAAGPEALREHIHSGRTPGDGPYTFQEVKDDGTHVYARNPHFAGNAARVSELHICNDRNARCADATRATYWPVLSSASEQRVRDINKGLRELTSAQISRPYFFFLIIAGMPEFSTVQARRTLLGALRRDEIPQWDPNASISDTFREVDGLAAPSTSTTDDARKLLSVFTSQRPLPLICVDTSGGAEAFYCDLVTRSLREAGAYVKVNKLTTTERTRLTDDGGFVGITLTQSNGDDVTPRAWGVTRAGSGHYNYSRSIGFGWGPAQQKLVEVSQTSLYQERREAALDELARQYAQVLPTIPLARTMAVVTWDSRLRGETKLFRNLEDWYTVSPEQLAAENAAAAASTAPMVTEGASGTGVAAPTTGAATAGTPASPAPSLGAPPPVR